MEQILKGKIAIVTGAGSGIGRETALLFAVNGAKVVVSDIDNTGGNKTVNMIKAAGGDALFAHADVGIAADCEKLVNTTVTHYGRLDIACNNAGISGEQAPLADMSIENWKHVMAINLDSVFYGMKYQIAAMLKTGGGSIVNVSSILGAVGFAGAAAYTAAKHGLVGLTKTAALDHSQQGIRVNAVGPGFINTPLLAGLDENLMTMLASMHPIGRIGQPREIAELILWLSSDKASFATGSYYPIDGGYLAR